MNDLACLEDQLQPNLGSTQREQNPSVSWLILHTMWSLLLLMSTQYFGLGPLAVLITGGTFVSIFRSLSRLFGNLSIGHSRELYCQQIPCQYW